MTSRHLFMTAMVAVSAALYACRYSEPEPQTPDSKASSSSSSESSAPSASDSDSDSSSSSASDDSSGTNEVSNDAKREPTEASGACDDRQCVADQDCCKGYGCSFDPERSKVQRYCVKE